MSMEYRAIKDFCNVSSSKRIFAEQYVDEGIPFYRQKEIIEKGMHHAIEEPIYISEETYNNIKTKFGAPQEGDLLITAVGVTLGIPYVVDDEVFYFKDGNLIWLNKFDESVNSKFVYYWFSTSFGHDSIYMRAIGSAQPAITIDIVKKYKLFLPDRRTQDRIVEIVSVYDQTIENNNKRIKILEQMAENLYKEWFVRFRFPGHEDVEFENGIPKGWEITKLGNVANICTGKCNREDAEEDGAYPLFDRSQEIKKSSVWLMDCEAIIVPGEGTSFIPRYYIGKFNLHQRCYCVEPKEKGLGKFLYYMLLLNRHYFLMVATGATVPSLRYNNFANMKFIMPDHMVCSIFEDKVTTIFRSIDILKKKNDNLIKQRDLLLPRLISGKLRV